MVENFQRASDLFILHPLRQDSKSEFLTELLERFYRLKQIDNSIDCVFLCVWKFPDIKYPIRAKIIRVIIIMCACFHQPILWVALVNALINCWTWQIAKAAFNCAVHKASYLKHVHCIAIKVFAKSVTVNRIANAPSTMRVIFVSIIDALATVKIMAFVMLMRQK